MSATPNDSSYKHTFLFDNNAMIDLGTLGNANCQSVAYDINDLGQIVGESTLDAASSDLHAFLYEDGTMVDLLDPASGWTLVSASAVNDNGWIVGYGVNAAGDTRAVHGGAGPHRGGGAAFRGMETKLAAPDDRRLRSGLTAR